MAAGVDLIRTVPLSFLRWWLDELAGLMPGWLKPGGERRRSALILDIGDGEAVLRASTARGEREISRTKSVQLPERADVGLEGFTALGGRRFAGWPLTVRLASHLGIRKTVELPLAAKDNLGDLLRFELDRLTPFQADELYFAWSIPETRPSEGRMTVALEMAPKALVDPAIDGAGRFGRSVDRVEIERSSGQPSLNLLPVTASPSDEKGWLSRMLPLLVLLLAVVAARIPFHEQDRQIDRLDQAIAAVRPAAEESLDLRQRLDAELSEAGFLAKARNDRTGMTLLLAELTELLPDQSYLVQLEIDGDSVKLQGLADKASELITILDRSEAFTSPEFRSPVTRDSKSGKERFQITVERSGQPS